MDAGELNGPDLCLSWGLLTLINPCVLPVLPIVLATSLQADRRAPLALAAGMSVSFEPLVWGWQRWVRHLG